MASHVAACVAVEDDLRPKALAASQRSGAAYQVLSTIATETGLCAAHREDAQGKDLSKTGESTYTNCLQCSLSDVGPVSGLRMILTQTCVPFIRT